MFVGCVPFESKAAEGSRPWQPRAAQSSPRQPISDTRFSSTPDMLLLLGFRLHYWPRFSVPKTNFSRKHLPQPPDPIESHSKPIVASRHPHPYHHFLLFFVGCPLVCEFVCVGVFLCVCLLVFHCLSVCLYLCLYVCMFVCVCVACVA